jgi:hypothetical protein
LISTSALLDAGRRLVEPALIAEKRPQLAVINRKVVSEVAATKPAWIVSSYVLSQMPPQELEEYFNNLLQFMEGGGKGDPTSAVSLAHDAICKNGLVSQQGQDGEEACQARPRSSCGRHTTTHK